MPRRKKALARTLFDTHAHTHTHTHTLWAEKCYYNLLLISSSLLGEAGEEGVGGARAPRRVQARKHEAQASQLALCVCVFVCGARCLPVSVCGSCERARKCRLVSVLSCFTVTATTTTTRQHGLCTFHSIFGRRRLFFLHCCCCCCTCEWATRCMCVCECVGVCDSVLLVSISVSVYKFPFFLLR